MTRIAPEPLPPAPESLFVFLSLGSFSLGFSGAAFACLPALATPAPPKPFRLTGPERVVTRWARGAMSSMKARACSCRQEGLGAAASVLGRWTRLALKSRHPYTQLANQRQLVGVQNISHVLQPLMPLT